MEDRLRKTEDRLREIDGRLPAVDRSGSNDVRANPFRVNVRPDAFSAVAATLPIGAVVAPRRPATSEVPKKADPHDQARFCWVCGEAIGDIPDAQYRPFLTNCGKPECKDASRHVLRDRVRRDGERRA